MSHNSDAEFVAQLRGMATSLPPISVPGTESIVRAGRSRVARRRSAFAGAFGFALLAGAGLTTLPGLAGSGATQTPVGIVAQQETIAPHSAITPRDLVSEPVEVAAPLVGPAVSSEMSADDEAIVEAGTATDVRGLTPLATGLGIAGTASLATAAGLAVRSRRLQPAPVRALGRLSNCG